MAKSLPLGGFTFQHREKLVAEPVPSDHHRLVEAALFPNLPSVGDVEVQGCTRPGVYESKLAVVVGYEVDERDELRLLRAKYQAREDG
jgi:hypothetical protein